MKYIDEVIKSFKEKYSALFTIKSNKVDLGDNLESFIRKALEDQEKMFNGSDYGKMSKAILKSQDEE